MRSFTASLVSHSRAIPLGASLLGGFLKLRLGTKHAEYWRQIGAPKLMFWLWQSRFDDLDDSVTIGIARLLKVLVMVFFARRRAFLRPALFLRVRKAVSASNQRLERP